MERRATVLRIDRKSVVVDLDDGTVLEGTVRGRLHHGHRRETSPVAVGDVVTIDAPGAGTCTVTGVAPRRSVLLRPEIHGRWKQQVLVANADVAVLIFAHRDPVPSAGLVDRLLFACHAGGVAPALVFNKADLVPDDATAALLALYAGLGYRLLRTSAESGEGIDGLAALVRDRCCVFAGPSGTGKTSLLNRVLPGLELRTGEISRVTGKGRHTTTAARLVRIPGGTGHVIDTPGIREFGISGIAPDEAALQFPEFPDPGSCRFADCAHAAEPGCAVRDALASGRLAKSRYDSYRTFRRELEEEHRRVSEGG